LPPQKELVHSMAEHF